MATASDSFREASSAISSSADHEGMRGRTRDRSVTRSKTMGPDESSTLRGRSRRRSTSPFGRTSRASSPSASVLSPTSRLLLHGRLRDKRREHCPSRAASPTSQSALRRRQRTRSRSRGPRMEQELHHRPVDLSGLRNEVFLSDEDASNRASR